MDKRDRIIATFVLVGMVLACLWWDYYNEGPSFVLAMVLMTAPVLAGVIMVTSMSLVRFGLMLTTTGFAFGFFSVPLAFAAIVSLGTAGLWLYLAVPIALVSMFVFAFGILAALLGAVFSNRTAIEPPPSGSIGS
jgi:hypothetical protein